MQVVNPIFMNNYFYHTEGNAPGAYAMRQAASFNQLVQNNGFQQNYQSIFNDGSTSGGYYFENFSINELNPGNFMNDSMVEHAVNNYDCWDANITNLQDEDGAHGTGDMDCRLRDFFNGWESAPGNTKSSNTNAVNDQSYDRYHATLGTILGTPGYHSAYLSNSGSNLATLQEGSGNGGTSPAVPQDLLVQSTTIFWANWDVSQSAILFCGTSANTGYSSLCGSTSTVALGASTYPGFAPVMGDTAIGQSPMPASFYYTSRPLWHSSSIPFPIIGPDVSSGNVGQCGGIINTVAQYAKVPATNASQCAGQGLNAAWGGHVNANPMMAYLLSLGMPPDGTGSVLSSFDETAFYTSSTVANPTFSPSPGTYSGPITLATVTAGATICYRTDGTNPAASVAGTCDAGSTTYSGTITFSTTHTILALATLSGSTNSSVVSGTYTFQQLGPAPASFADELLYSFPFGE